MNLRPGLKGNLEVMYPLRLDDSNVHGLISGVTGSGKSVLLNTMIMNLLYEYPSWELDLFLVDFKKVEFSRYLSLQDKPSPSVNAVGATEEVSYVVSLIKYIYDVMNAREMLFSKLNQTHIKGFREKYDVVLPRVVLIVDEFQQMFLEASNKETAQINEYLTAITKKGRATGIHLLFASQEMSNTLPQNVKMNFQLRMVLPCTKEVSIEVLGNSAGATLEAFHMLANKGSRNAENNIKFLIPFIDTAKEDEQGNTVFVNLLEELKKISSSFSFKKPHKYYEETSTDSIRELVKLKKNRNVQKEIKKIINDSSQYSESIILGPAVTYNSKEIDYESIFIEDSKSNNIACHSPNLHKAAYLLNLLFLNFYFSEKKYRHIVINRSPGIYNQYPIVEKAKELKLDKENADDCSDEFTKDKDVIKQFIIFERRILVYAALVATSDIATYFKHLDKQIDNTRFLKKEKDRAVIKELSDGIEKANNLLNCEENLKDNQYYQLFSMYHHQNKSIDELFKPIIFWVIGADNFYQLFKEVERMQLIDANSVNVVFIFVTSSLENNQVRDFMKKNCNYIFLSDASAETYSRFKGVLAKRGTDSIVVDLIVSHLSKKISFKQFKADLKEIQVKSLDFDTLMTEVMNE